ncbi:hypothetical protein GGI03_006497, partial [Coemansia sp. RSA 2337]
MWARRFAGSILNSRLATGISQLGRPLIPAAKPLASAFAMPKFSVQQTRGLQNLQPRRRKYKKAQK